MYKKTVEQIQAECNMYLDSINNQDLYIDREEKPRRHIETYSEKQERKRQEQEFNTWYTRAWK